MGWRQHGENLGSSTEKTVDKTIGTPPVFDMLGMIIPHKQSEKSRPQSVDSKANDKNACYVYEAVN